jgi:hypothetical protein
MAGDGRRPGTAILTSRVFAGRDGAIVGRRDPMRAPRAVPDGMAAPHGAADARHGPANA